MMTRRWAIAAGMAVTAAGLSAQSGGGFGVGGGRGGSMEFQQASSMNSVAPRAVAGRTTTLGPLAVIGRPFSATEERKSIQKLGDGTEISNSETNLVYRDSQGRTRVEQTWQGKTVISILDPVGMVFMDVDPVAKTVHKTSIPETATRGGISIAGGQISRSFASANGGMSTFTVATGQMVSGSMGGGSAVALPRTAAPSATAGGTVGGMAVAGGRGGGGGGVLTAAPAANAPKEEELGVQSTNGVLAVGKRSTVTIPQGQIGNNRDIHIINERWFSEDLQMTVKTVNSDPRFGDNIYEMTGISRNEPEPSLFQIPAGYTVTEAPSGGMFRATPVALPAVIK